MMRVCPSSKPHSSQPNPQPRQSRKEAFLASIRDDYLVALPTARSNSTDSMESDESKIQKRRLKRTDQRAPSRTESRDSSINSDGTSVSGEELDKRLVLPPIAITTIKKMTKTAPAPRSHIYRPTPLRPSITSDPIRSLNPGITTQPKPWPRRLPPLDEEFVRRINDYITSLKLSTQTSDPHSHTFTT